MTDRSATAVCVATGDMLHRKSRRWALIALLALIITLPCALWARSLFARIGGWDMGAAYMLVSGLWALVLAAGPLVVVVCALVALFLRMEASVRPRTGRHPLGDGVILAGTVLVTLAPALVALYPPVHALVVHTIGFRGLGQQYPLATDPYGFWQAVAFWFMGAASLAFLAGVYWRWKWRQFQTRHAMTLPSVSGMH